MDDIVFGRNPVAETLKSGRAIEKILVRRGRPEGSLIPIISMARAAKIPVSETDRRRLDEISGGQNHQGVIAYVSEYKYASLEDILQRAYDRDEPPFVIICDKITDPHNLGAILRTANCAGAHGVIIPRRGSVGLSGAAVKTAAGAAEHTPVARVTNISAAIDKLKKEGLWICAADMDGEPLYKANLTGALGIVIGSEGDGVSRLVRENCDFAVSVPMRGEISSLNASVAAAVIMYEALRQRTNN